MSSGGLTATDLRPDLGFNWVFLVELLVCGIVTLFFLFYFNRVFATLISYGIRAWTWHKYRVYIDIQALQISLLGGRVFFKGLRYHGNNETILVHSGFITWTYWLRNVRELEIENVNDLEQDRPTSGSNDGGKRSTTSEDAEQKKDGGEAGAKYPPPKLPCRFNILLTGVEWFVYNKSAAYDAVLAGMLQDDREFVSDNGYEQPNAKQDLKGEKGERTGKRSSSGSDTSYTKANPESQKPNQHSTSPEKTAYGTQTYNTASHQSTFDSQQETKPPVHTSPEGAFILRFLPVHISCSKAALVLGNENTKSVLIAKVDKASGEIDAAKCNPLDQYRQLINFDLEHPVVQIKPNDDYKEDQSAAASKTKRGADSDDVPAHEHTHSFFHRQRRKAYHALQDLVPYLRSSVESFSSNSTEDQPTSTKAGAASSNWQGLSRYLDENEQDDKARWSSIEYATVSTIIDSPKAKMSFYWDVVGTVSKDSEPTESNLDKLDNINGKNAPDWGINLSIQGAIINYGPWADRQRADIQRVFFPSLCKDAKPAKKLVPGQFRVPTEFKLYVQFDEETILRVPIREESKNWKWTKQADTMGTHQQVQKRNSNKSRKRKSDKGNPSPEIRPFGWLDIKVGADATISYVMDMVAGPSGFSNQVALDLPNIEITTSVNHGLLWRSRANQILCDLSNPLQWNTLRSWKFDIASQGLELFLLREHIFLLTDLVDDWGSGPPPEYLTFTPFEYLLNLKLEDFQLYLNVNDSNIINNPSDLDDNTFIIIFGAALTADVSIPLINYRPHRNEVAFSVKANTGGLQLHVPPWNTQASFLASLELAQLKTLGIDGSYQYCSTTSVGNTDTLILNVHGHSPSCHFYGFVIRYFLKVKDNYFGEDIHFKTLEEHQETLRAKRETALVENIQPQKKSNDLDVILGVTANESSVILPSNLYSAKNHTRIEIATLAADMRFTNYYMDLEVELSTLGFSQGNADDGIGTPLSATSSTQLFIDGINVTGNRLFGLPPTEPTYMCNWDFAVGAVTGECTSEFLKQIAQGGSCFAFSFDDDENALPSISEILLHDVTFLRQSFTSIHVWLHVDEAAFLISTGEMSLYFNDWAGSRYSTRVDINIPRLQLGCVDAESASRHRSRANQSVETHALIETTVSFAMIERKLGFFKERDLQQEHIRYHDQRTRRTDFLLRPGVQEAAIPDAIDVPAMCVPPMPEPIMEGSDSQMASENSSMVSSLRSARGLVKRKSSFLSFSSTSQRSGNSVVRPQSSLRIREPSTSVPRSRSTHLNKPASHRDQLRDPSASTGRPSSFYSAVGDSRGLPPTSVTFSSSFIAPYFPLESVYPDEKDLPPLTKNREEPSTAKETYLQLDDIQPDRVDDAATHTSLIVELPFGVAAFFTPKAIDAVASLLAVLQPTDPIDLLDSLQIASMRDVFDLNKQKVMTSKVLDLSVRAPEIKIRFLNFSDAAERSCDKHDQYDLSLVRLAVTSRSETAVKPRSTTITSRSETVPRSHGIAKPRESSSLHLSLAAAGLSAKERFGDLDDPQAAINGGFEDLVFWMASGNITSANISLKVIEATTVSRKIEYLASLLHRTNITVESISETFSDVFARPQARLQTLIHLVATGGQEAKDPSFLTRPSYVLRSATDHLRTNDSWKVVSRLRHMYTSLDSNARREIAFSCINNPSPVSLEAQHLVLSVFTQWRSWDLNNLKTCLVMSRVYGSSTDISTNAPELRTHSLLSVSFRAELIRLVLDPGPKQNEISFSAITTIVETKVDFPETEPEPRTQAVPTHKTTIQLHCGDASINLNWDLCELTGDILKLYHQSDVNNHAASIASTTHSRLKAINSDSIVSPRKVFHVVVTSGSGSIALDTINLHAVSISKGLKFSFVMDSNAGDGETLANIMVAAEAATSKIRSHSQELTLSQLRFPCVFLSFERGTTNGTTKNLFKVAASSQELSYVVRQDTLALIEVIDLLLGDEVTQLSELRKNLPTSSTSKPQPTLAETETINKVNVALFLDMYHISIPLLQSLTYNISGVVARTTVVAQLGSSIVFDFDIKEHSHDIQTSNCKPHSISLLQMPPTNGRITSTAHNQETVISVFASVEPVELDAAAIHSLLTALNRPEISSVINDVQEDIKGIKEHVAQIFGSSKGETQSKDSIQSDIGKPVIYDAHLTLAGFDIFAKSPEAEVAQNTARIDFNLGSVQFHATNRLNAEGPALAFPEIRVGLRHIIFQLSKWADDHMEPCGSLIFEAFLTATSKQTESRDDVRSYHLRSDKLEINLFAETASSVVDIMGHLKNKIKDLDLSREKNYLRKLRKAKPRIAFNDEQQSETESLSASTTLFESMYSLELLNIQVSWLVGSVKSSEEEVEDLVLSLKRIDLSTRKENSARLTIEDLQLQMVPVSQNKSLRSLNSALLPEVIFNVGYVSTSDARRLAFQAAGKSLDLRLTSQFIRPASELKRSIGSSVEKVRAATAMWNTHATSDPSANNTTKPFFGKKRMESLLVDADFAGAVVHLSGKKVLRSQARNGENASGRYGQFTHTDANSDTVLRAPGLAWKVEYKDSGLDESSLNAEVKVDASSNILYPAVVPLILEISSAVKEVVSDDSDARESSQLKTSPQKFMKADEDNILTADPSAVLGRTRLNLGLRICRQEFSLSCQPIARVAATARFDNIYMTINTVRSTEHGHFFAASATFQKLQASVQHVYSREATGSFAVDSIFVSLMNSKHVSGTSGVSAILNISPMKALVNAKQLQDFLLFREIWVPPEIRQGSATPMQSPATQQSQTFLVQRYQEVAATGAFPWNATVSIEELDVQLDLGQAIGKSAFVISKFWISSKKNSDWEQNLCLGFDRVGVDSSGRMSGFVTLQDFKMRTSIQWPAREKALNQTPLVQGSLAFSQFRVKAAFDYQAFLVADITSFEFLMYNVRSGSNATSDRLVAILNGEAVQVFCTTTSASQALALYQAFLRLVQEKRTNYEASLTEIERFMRRKSVAQPAANPVLTQYDGSGDINNSKSPISLHTDVIVTLKAVNLGAFPSTFSDHQVFKLEALNAQARFAVNMDNGKIHSTLGLTLGQLRIGLAGVKRVDPPKSVGDISVEDVVSSATGSRGGTILKVPKVEATMQTWQVPNSNHIDYIFKSSFEGKVEVGWNYSRISYIRNMWATHSKALAQRLGKPLPPSAVKITGVPDGEDGERKTGEQQKITAEVNVPQSKYDYAALEAPIIETPQLRDMGEATPPLEWIGLHRDRLPNLTHQIVIVTLLELASEVEDAYGKILGSS
ncbi:fermentation associated protein [Phlyctema vagabunda]|uniref:Fermentation associated protein n=1 Tax=Phlyctema vagabunda TaxID=108571 RepID=A0ABR4P4M6_9HELO